MKFFKATKSKDKSLKFFEEGYHQLHDDNEMTSLQKYIFKWCKQRSLKTFAFSNYFLFFIKINSFNRRNRK